MFKKVVSVMAIAMMCASALSGCGASDSGTDASVSSEGGNAGSDSSKGVVTLDLWGSWSGDGLERVNQQLDIFNSQSEDIKVKYTLQQNMEQKLLTAIAGGDVPDVLLWDRFQTSLYAPKGALLPIDDYVAADGVDTSMFYEEAVKEISNNGKLYGLPLVVDNRALLYNKTLFKEVGLDPEKPPTTWAELEEAAMKLTVWEGNKLVRAGFSLNDVGLFNTWIQQAGGSMLNEDGSKTAFNSEAGLEVLRFWDKLLNEDKIYTIGFDAGLAQGEDPFITGKVAMKWDGPWALANLAKYADTLEFGVAPLPAGPRGDTGAMMGGFGLAICSKAEHPDEAWKLMKWWTMEPENNKNFALISGNIPANKEAAQDAAFTEDDHYKGFVKNMEWAIIRPPVPGYSQMEGNALIANLQLYVNGDMSAEDALKDAQMKGDKILEENREE